MDLSILLAQVMGVYLAVAGVAMFIKQGSMRQTIRDFFKNDSLAYIAGAMTLIVGLLVVLNHNIWDGTWKTVVTVIGWIILLKGACYMLLPESAMRKMTGMLTGKGMYGLWGVIAVAVGIYLMMQGFPMM